MFRRQNSDETDLRFWYFHRIVCDPKNLFRLRLHLQFALSFAKLEGLVHVIDVTRNVKAECEAESGNSFRQSETAERAGRIREAFVKNYPALENWTHISEKS
ncbi:jg16810 [Pararge aegeria aegeria]|uniref:Jg16810 protein n=1 Tax=Pararge aegeria aegeria TaxID=348720 RepID=A0A8S4QMN4_9NEOP|nr:jg16810 [Pararge aegeria aegeria]